MQGEMVVVKLQKWTLNFHFINILISLAAKGFAHSSINYISCLANSDINIKPQSTRFCIAKAAW